MYAHEVRKQPKLTFENEPMSNWLRFCLYIDIDTELIGIKAKLLNKAMLSCKSTSQTDSI